MATRDREGGKTTAKTTALGLMASVFCLGAGLPVLGGAQPAIAPPASTAAQVEKMPVPAEGTVKSQATLAGRVQIKTTDQGIRYASGGVGQEEREEIRALSGEFNLELMFAIQGGGEYLADVQVNVLDAKGAVVLSATSKGPYFIAQLPKGSYTVEVSANNESQKKTVQISSDQVKLSFYWR